MKPIRINGKDYELPKLDDLTLDECIIVEKHSGKTIDQVELGEHLDVGALKGVLHVAILRAEPAVSFEEVSQALGTLKLTEIAAQWKGEDEQAGQSPPASETPPASDGSAEPSGSDGESSSGLPPAASDPPPTGSHGSEPPTVSDPATSEDSPHGNLRAVGSS